MPNKRRAPISHLSAVDQFAVIESFNNGALQKRDGCWYGSLDGKPISGNTVANLCRDGLLSVTKKKLTGSAQLTERGEWFARTLLARPADKVIE
jgi:hypothetical protein